MARTHPPQTTLCLPTSLVGLGWRWQQAPVATLRDVIHAAGVYLAPYVLTNDPLRSSDDLLQLQRWQRAWNALEPTRGQDPPVGLGADYSSCLEGRRALEHPSWRRGGDGLSHHAGGTGWVSQWGALADPVALQPGAASVEQHQYIGVSPIMQAFSQGGRMPSTKTPTQTHRREHPKLAHTGRCADAQAPGAATPDHTRAAPIAHDQGAGTPQAA